MFLRSGRSGKNRTRRAETAVSHIRARHAGAQLSGFPQYHVD